MRPALVFTVLALGVAVSTACGRGEDSGTTQVADGLTVVVDGLDGPTQMIEGPDGRLWVAQLAGPENAGRGEVVAIDPEEPSRRQVLLDGLDKPTGIAVLDGALWIQQPTSLLRAPLDLTAPPAQVDTPEVVLDDLPNNGRSQGTLTVTPDGTLLYETSGARRGSDSVEGSGILWELDPDDPGTPRVRARGLKNAYARTLLPDGRLVLTDVLEPLPGVAAEDEVNVLAADGGNADFGWPRCVGDRQPVVDLGVGEADCQDTAAPIALLGTGSTPTSVVLSPWDPDQLLVARWNAGDVVMVPLAGGTPQVVIDALEHPQHLLVVDDHVLVTDHATGTISRWRRMP